MQKWGFYIIILCAGFLPAVMMPEIAACDHSLTLNFGKTKPETFVTLQQPLAISSITKNTAGLLIETTGLTGIHTGQVLPASRLKLTAGAEIYQLSPTALMVNLARRQNNTGNRLITMLSLELFPSDWPDQYSGKILIKPWLNDCGTRIWSQSVILEVTVEVMPWIKLNCDSDSVTLERTSYSGLAIQNKPLCLKVASNSNWILYCRIQPPYQELIPQIKISVVNSNRVQLLNHTGSLSNNRKNLALGTATTVNQNYWCVLLLSLEIKDITKIPARKYTVPLEFTAELWDGKTF
ncbi:MAG TPA: hypothetical protein VIM29_11110 [Bacillota bacterium]